MLHGTIKTSIIYLLSMKTYYKTNIFNITNTTKHHRKKTAPLTYCFQSLSGQFFGTHFLISFLKLLSLLSKLVSLIFTGNFGA